VNHPLFEVLGVALILITLPGSVELALLTFAAIASRQRLAERSEQQDEWRYTDLISGEQQVRRLAVVIPAHNEAATITRAVHSLMQCDRPLSLAELSIVVVADNCSDGTAELALNAGARVIERNDNEQRGKGFALQFAFVQLVSENFDAVLVIDADSVVDANLLQEVVHLLNCGADGVQTRYLMLNPGESAGARLRNVALMAFNVLRPLGRHRLRLSCGIHGNGFALTRRTLEAVAYGAHSIVEDLEYHLRLVQSGRRIVFANRTTVRAEMPATGVAARTQRIRWEGGRGRMIVQNVPTVAREVIHGNFRMLEPLLELLLLPLGIHVLLLLCTAAVPFAAARIYAGFALMLVALHVSMGIIVGGGSFSDLNAIVALPGYLAWKLTLIPATLRSAAANTEWIRTQR
jgi:cellulose synthase/poly-beta-1,6-N-acetylglucosamine synthase-like glycosyltransferase